MTYIRTWSPERVHAVMTTESRQKSPTLFLSTHRPFKRIRVDFCKERATTDFIGEHDVRDIIHAGRLDDDNRLFFVVGEAGCGKSEICQWLEYTADPATRMAVHIPRSMTTALGVARLLRTHLGLITPGILHTTPIDTQAQLITLAALTHWYESGSPEVPNTQPWERILTSPAIIQVVADFLRLEPDPSSSACIVDNATLSAACESEGLRLDDYALATASKAVDGLLMHAMERLLWAGDVRALLRNLSERAVESGRRPLLLIEDITAFQTFGDVLLDYLLDLTSGHMDAVIGVTTGFERSQLPRATLSGDLTHVHHRLRARFVLTDEHGCAYGLEDDLVEFARAYLRAVKDMDSGVVAQCTPPGFDPDLYPFTATALRRAFMHLEEDGNSRQTPRLFIEHVLAAALLAPDPPPTTLDTSRYLRRPPTHVRREATADAAFGAVLRWYADIHDSCVTLDARIPSAWGIPAPADALHGSLLTFPRAYVARTGDAPQPTAERDREVAELQQWLDQGGHYPSRETLKRAVERAMRDLGDPRSLGSPDAISQNSAGFYYARGDERLPIILADASGDVAYPGGAVAVTVTRQPDERAILEELALRELTGAPLADVCQNVTLTLEWVRRRFDAYQSNVRAEFARRLGGLDPDELILLSWRLVATLCGRPWSDWPHLAPLHPDLSREGSIGPWDRASHPGCVTSGRALSGWHEEIRRLFIGAFTLHDTFLDIERFRAVSRCMDEQQTLQRVAALPINTLGSLPFKVKPSSCALPQLLADLQRYARAIVQLNIPAALASDLDELDVRSRHLQAQRTLDVGLLRVQFNDLHERSRTLGVPWQADWEEALSILEEICPDTVSAMLERATQQQIAGAALQMAACDVWAYQLWRLDVAAAVGHPYWTARATLGAIQQALLLAAKSRVPRKPKAIVGTREYRSLQAAVRVVEEEMSCHGTSTD